MRCEAWNKNNFQLYILVLLAIIFMNTTTQCADFETILPGKVREGFIRFGHLVNILPLLNCLPFIL